MEIEIAPAERKRLAEMAGLSPAYVYQCLSGIRDMGPVVAVRTEEATGGKLHRKILCQKTWRLVWPELAAQEVA